MRARNHATQVPTVAPSTAPAATSASSGAITVKIAQIQGFGLFLTDDLGRTLYAFDNDKKDTSNCTGDCLKNWPPFIVRETPKAGGRINASLLTTFTRADGAIQAQYDSHPLYYYSPYAASRTGCNSRSVEKATCRAFT